MPNQPTNGRTNLTNHYARISAARRAAGLEGLESPQARVESAKDALNRIVRDYLNDDPKSPEIAERILQEGGEGLRMLAARDEEGLRRRPEILPGLEAIVRTDGSRPSFLIRNGEIDRDSSPLGTWAGLLDGSASRPCGGHVSPGGPARA